LDPAECHGSLTEMDDALAKSNPFGEAKEKLI
jgi:hypothetical protein